MKTAITELFGITYPILNAGMGKVALPKMVAAVSNAGGLGNYGAGSHPPEVTRAAIREIRSLTDKPFAANVPLALPNGKENMQVLLEERVPIINYSMGKGDWIVKRAHGYGGKVVASVNGVQLAKRAQEHGVDAVIATGHEAAGHASDVTTFVLIPRLAETLRIPIIAAGGIGNGAGLAAALALGADGVSMGTCFLTTQESPLHQNFKKKAIESEIDNTIFSTRFDGFPCRVLQSSGAERMVKARLNVVKIFLDSFSIAKELDTPYLKLLWQVLSLGPTRIEQMMRMSRMLKSHVITLTTGDLEAGVTAAGMSVGLVHDAPTVAELIERVVKEAHASRNKLNVQIVNVVTPVGK
ncbi:enoyl-[acyl carrier protein] reductase II (plasmid) [Azospirillum sp. B510]|uniref:NAD(P)H-dependent flavin oxidoreductase n=1 Tax=Azospirillum sp. (strain B510) TaxID=137722 RepID=UPI0001C4CB86|nr:nitronate monooxygenase [Azospirillum sp. B510]BAI74823.1 enoyl-[acyl carrier protein] reductase II [Azospirillum sp. B510]